jgi:hypothetical protein
MTNTNEDQPQIVYAIDQEGFDYVQNVLNDAIWTLSYVITGPKTSSQLTIDACQRMAERLGSLSSAMKLGREMNLGLVSDDEVAERQKGLVIPEGRRHA